MYFKFVNYLFFKNKIFDFYNKFIFSFIFTYRNKYNFSLIKKH